MGWQSLNAEHSTFNSQLTCFADRSATGKSGRDAFNFPKE